jgi:hypothetical protein
MNDGIRSIRRTLRCIDGPEYVVHKRSIEFLRAAECRDDGWCRILMRNVRCLYLETLRHAHASCFVHPSGWIDSEIYLMPSAS